jgi:uncharacterized protein YndB with AHSA1/START domain
VTEPIYEQTVRVDARPEAVFDLFASAEALVRWIGVAAEVDCQPGGSLRVDVTGGDVAAGAFEVVDRPNRLVFTWGWEGSATVPPGSSRVEVDFRAEGEATVVRFVHRALPPPEVENHGHGWQHYLERLSEAATGDPGPDPWVTTPKEG